MRATHPTGARRAKATPSDSPASKRAHGDTPRATRNARRAPDPRAAWERALLAALRAAERGEFDVRLPVPASAHAPEAREVEIQINAAFNALVARAAAVTGELGRVARDVGVEGRLGARAEVGDAAGAWRDLADRVNAMSDALSAQLRDIAAVTTSVARGDLSRTISVDVKGELLALKTTINVMVEQLAQFVAEVERLAREVGTEGRLGVQAYVPGVAGVWDGLIRNVNSMAENLTTQVRGIARVLTAVAHGDLSQRFSVDAAGEVAALAATINHMTDTLSVFAEQVIDVAREVGIEGRLGGQAHVPGARGTWRRLTDNVNELAASLTTQIRAISEVATSVAQGDLSRAINVRAQGEVAALKDNVNRMIVALKETTRQNHEQDWLKSNLARFSTLLQGERRLDALAQTILSELAPLVGAQHAAFFVLERAGDSGAASEPRAEGELVFVAGYARAATGDAPPRFRLGEGLVGQCALDRRPIVLDHVPGGYVRVRSGLGDAPPVALAVLPVVFEGEVKAVIELAALAPFQPIHRTLLEQLTHSIGVVLHTIGATMRTESLLRQSQALTEELQSQSRELTAQQDALRRTNAALAQQALELEDKAAQLAQSARVKSEFLANMSHELRTPLNSVMILARLLAGNAQKNLSDKQVEYARTIVSAGSDLLALINEVLDLARIEAGKMRIEPREVLLDEVRTSVARGFEAMAEQKGLRFEVTVAPDTPAAIRTDPLRLAQVLRNLLANAFKFTEAGAVRLAIGVLDPHAPLMDEAWALPLRARGRVLAFAVSDTGIGIAADKHELIFEAFQQADGTTSRRYGGTGLGLSISRELARLLGGELRVQSAPGQGSTFTLYLPERHAEPERAARERGELARAASPLPVAGTQAAREGASDDAASRVPALSPSPPRADHERGDAPGALAGRKVLIVDDDMRNIFALASLLESEQAEVLFAEDGRAGIAQLAAHPDVDAVLMDVMMPEMDGLETMRAIRDDPRYGAVPIIAITAKALADDRARCVSAGASEYLPKPVDSRRLVELLRNAAPR